VASLEWSEQALASLDQLVLSHSLPADTRERVETSAQPLARFPRLGPEIRALDDGSLRFLIGPWRWLVIVYLHLEAEQRVVVVSVEDGRAATATITRERGEPPPA
jgi:plasmid stabilization system protein ParE